MNFDLLKRSVTGEVVTRGEASYAATRNGLVWNGRKPQRYPDAIVKVSSIADVQAAVRFAADAGLRVSARGAGHQFSGIAVQEGIVLDLAALDQIDVDPDQMLAKVGRRCAMAMPPAPSANMAWPSRSVIAPRCR